MANSDGKADGSPEQIYVSCIKIHGMRILPPLLNDAKRKLMQYYRELAVQAEQRIIWRNTKQKLFDSSDEGHSPTYFDSDTSSRSDSIVCSSDDNTLKSQFMFSENCQDDVLRMLKDVDEIRIKSKATHAYTVKMPSLDSSAITNVPFINKSDNIKKFIVSENDDNVDSITENKIINENSGNKMHFNFEPVNNKKISNENSNIIIPANNNRMNQSAIENNADNSHIIRNLTLPESNITLQQQSYTVANPDKVFTDETFKELIAISNTSEKYSILFAENKHKIENVCSITNNETSEITDKSTNDSADSERVASKITSNSESKKNSNSPPSLVRSNSYILEKPSPFLLAQIKRDQEVKRIGNCNRKQRRSWDFANAREKWSSIEHDLNTSKTSTKPVITKSKRQVSNSLPSSPDKKMFNTFCDNLPKKMYLNHALKKEYFDKHKQEMPQRIKHYKRTVSKPTSISGSFVKSFVTPTRAPASYETEKELSPKKVNLEFKPKKLFTFCKTDIASKEKISKHNKSTNLNKSGSKAVFTNNESLENEISSKINPADISNGPKNTKFILVESNNIPDNYKPKNSSSPKATHTNHKISANVIASKIKLTETNDEVPEKLSSNIKPVETILSKSVEISDEVPDYMSAPQERIRDIFDKIQSDQSKQMAELIWRQKQEQERLMKTFCEQQTELLSNLKDTYRVCSTPIAKNKHKSVIKSNQLHLNTSDILKDSENILLECKLLKNDNLSEFSGNRSSHILSYTSHSSPEDTLANLTMTSEQNDNLSRNSNINHELSLRHGMNSPLYQVVTSANYSRQFSEDSLETGLATSNSLYNGNSVITQVEKNVILYNHNDRRRNSRSCCKQMFPTQKQIWAATKINAGARGYLTRRLLKTERVQSLIQTIKDTLLCAMELHHETAENIQPADVELHRRLVQQVTASCFTFYDMFFDLSKIEQMSVIALDRERLREKMLRPISARSASLTSTTQRVLQRKLRRVSNDSSSATHSRSSSSRSCHSAPESQTRSRLIGTSDLHCG